MTSDGSLSEYDAFVSLGIEDTIIGYPSPLFLNTYKINKYR